MAERGGRCSGIEESDWEGIGVAGVWSGLELRVEFKSDGVVVGSWVDLLCHGRLKTAFGRLISVWEGGFLWPWVDGK